MARAVDGRRGSSGGFSSMGNCIALMVSAPGSGHGKTSVTAGLAQHLCASGLRVRAFKWGPDFLDPSWLEAATGHPVDNLDLAMGGLADVQRRLAQAAQAADVLLVEAAMGLFDGQPCAADLAQQFKLPVALVIDTSHMAETFGALVLGMTQFRPSLRFAGVIANRVGSARHAELLQRGLSQVAQVAPAVPLLGVVHRQGSSIPSRHLGLQAAQGDAPTQLQPLADAMANTELARLLASKPEAWRVQWGDAPPTEPSMAQLLAGKTIAIARDAAFSFIYPANVACLQEMGARVQFFSPLAGDALPACDALWLPGGYPELHAQALGAQQALRAQLAAHVAQRKPVWAECGGMVALMQGIALQADAPAVPLLGVLPGWAQQCPRLQGLGMQAWPTAQGLLRGHGFHYSRVDTDMHAIAHTHRLLGEQQFDASKTMEAIYAHGSVRASYFHAWFASNPRWVAQLFTAPELEAQP